MPPPLARFRSGRPPSPRGGARAAGRLLVLLAFLATPAVGAGPVRVPRGETQLFVDDSRIAESHGLQRTLRPPRKDYEGREPVLSAPPLLGHATTLQANGTIVRDPRLGCWVMFALVFAPGLPAESPEGWQRVALARFTSRDGLAWTADAPQGLERVFPRARGDLFDPVSGAHAANVDACTVWFDPADPEWPYQAWFWLTRLPEGRAGAYFHRSRDGRVFERGDLILPSRARTIPHEGRRLVGPADTTRFSFDPESRRFLVTVKFYAYHAADRDPFTDNALRSRAFLFADRIDRPIDPAAIAAVQLVPAGRQARGDFPCDEYYDSTAYRYGSHWLGELKIWHGRGDHPWSPAGAAYLKFMSSPDGLAWHRAAYPNDDGVPEVFVANGRPEGGHAGRNDGGYITSFNSAPLRVGDELIYYYGASSYGKNAGAARRLTGGGIFRARLRLDGFVSVDAGQLTTPLLRFEGERLAINSRGLVRVEALAPNDRVLGTAQLGQDGVRLPLTFAGKTLRELVGPSAEVRLRFTVGDGAALYAFVIE